MIPAEWHASAFSTDPRVLVNGFAELGHEAVVVCHRGSTYPGGLPVLTESPSVLEDEVFWRGAGFDLAVVFTWVFRPAEIIDSIAAAGTVVVGKMDSDGFFDVRLHPKSTLGRTIYYTRGTVPRLRGVWYWLKRFLYLHEESRRRAVRNVESAHATIVETEDAQREVVRFLEHCGRDSLARKVHFVPTAVASAFCCAEVPAVKRRLVYAVGRWDEPLKRVGLLQSSLQLYLDSTPGASAVVVGGGGERVFRNHAHPRVDYRGQVDQLDLVDLLRDARVCLVTSRFEGCHIGGHEALAMGLTIVGPSIPAVQSMTSRGAYGRLARATPRALASALSEEMALWDDGDRDPREIASYWRSKLAPAAVAARIIDVSQNNSV